MSAKDRHKKMADLRVENEHLRKMNRALTLNASEQIERADKWKAAAVAFYNLEIVPAIKVPQEFWDAWYSDETGGE